MRVLIAPDSFKGSLSARQAAEHIQRGWEKVFPEAEYDLAPLADGGEGTAEAMVEASGGILRFEEVSDPLGRPVRAAWGQLGENGNGPKSAVVEAAAASGLTLLAGVERDVRLASSRGTGELVRAALRYLHSGNSRGQAARPRLIIGLGGSATNDAGSGAFSALGARFLDGNGRELPPGGAALAGLDSIDLSGLDPLLAETEILAACDVQAPLCGPRGATFIFGPQKDGQGIDRAGLAELDAALERFAAVAKSVSGKNAASEPGSGAAGGLGAGLLFFTPARLAPGVGLVLESINFSARAARADLIITGEGRTDAQSAMGKAPCGVGRAAKALGKPVFCLSGALGPGCETLLAEGVSAMAAAVCEPLPLEYCLENAARLLEEAAERSASLFMAGAAASRCQRSGT